MAQAARRTEPESLQIGPVSPNSTQIAQYTEELIDSLRKITKGPNTRLLSLLLEAASVEARRMAAREG